MKKLLLISTLVIAQYVHLSAQFCDEITASSEFIQGNLKYNMLRSGEVYNQLFRKVGIGADGDMATREYAPLMSSSNLWFAGRDPNGSLKMAIGFYDKQDWTAGPLDATGQTSQDNCEKWDKIFTVTREEIMKAREIVSNGGPCDGIPESVMMWPAAGNTNAGIEEGNVSADFYDANSDDIYNPCDGDIPFINDAKPHFHWFERLEHQIPSQISYYVINDNGKMHIEQSGSALQYQVGVHMFSYNIEELEDVIYLKYNIRNSGTDNKRDGSLGFWHDFELGCADNDYVGIDKDRGMVHVYNSSEELECEEEIGLPLGNHLGIADLQFRYVPYDIEIVDGEVVLVDPPINSWDFDTLVAATLEHGFVFPECDEDDPGDGYPYVPLTYCMPENDSQIYNTLLGRREDGGAVLNPDGEEVTMMFISDPSDENGWSQCTDDEKLGSSVVTSQTGGLLLYPSSETRLFQTIILANDEGSEGCQSMEALRHKHAMAERHYFRTFHHQYGPTPPSLVIKKVSNGLQIEIEDVPLSHSEKVIQEEYDIYYNSEVYKFEGIKIYQVKSKNFDMTELHNPELSRLVYQGDIENGISEIINYKSVFNKGERTDVPIIKAEGKDSGISKKLFLAEDIFTGNSFLDDEEYHFVAISYAYNKWEDYDPINHTGQKYPYLETRYGLKVVSTDDIVSVEDTNGDEPFIHVNSINGWSLEAQDSPLEVRVLTASGQLIATENLQIGNEINSNTYSLQQGLYFLQIIDTNRKKQYAIKVVSL